MNKTIASEQPSSFEFVFSLTEVKQMLLTALKLESVIETLCRKDDGEETAIFADSGTGFMKDFIA